MSEPRIEIDVRARERRLYDRLRARLAPLEPGGHSGARDVLLLIPDLVVLLARLARDPRVPFGAKLIAGAGLAYTLSPIDLLPDMLFGPLGLLDDALVAIAALSRVVNHVHPDLVAAHWPGRGSALEALQRVARWAEDTFRRALRQWVRPLLLGSRKAR
jgi:uncharacterized membrane protein YkvA (DUF1232 family)